MELIVCFISYYHYRKARRKERDGDQNQTDAKLYLEENVLERKLPDADLKLLVDLPPGLDYNEWLASHSKYNSIDTMVLRLLLIKIHLK